MRKYSFNIRISNDGTVYLSLASSAALSVNSF